MSDQVGYHDIMAHLSRVKQIKIGMIKKLKSNQICAIAAGKNDLHVLTNLNT